MRRTHQILLICILVAAIAILGVWQLFGKHRPQLSQREIATRVLAEYIASKRHPAHVLVMSNPFTQMRGHPAQAYSYQKAGVAGLQRGFGAKAELRIAFPKLKPGALQGSGVVYVDAQTKTPLSFLVAEDAFDEVTRKNPDCEVIVSLIGLPVKLNAVEAWTKGGAPAFGLLLPDWRMIGDTQGILSAFKSGKLLAAVLDKPGAPPDTLPVSGEYRSEFDARYILATAENIEGLLKSSPQLFTR